MIDETTRPGWTARDAMEAGETHIEVVCPACRLGLLYPWSLLPSLPLDQPMAEVGRRFRCRRCGGRASRVAATSQRDGEGYANRYS